MVTQLLSNPKVANQSLQKRRLLIDIDGVICEYDFPKIVWGKFHVKIKATDIYAYNISDTLGVSQQKVDEMFQEQVHGKPDFVKDAIETLREWQSKDYELVIFSNRVKYMGYRGLERWLIEWGVPYDVIDGGQGKYDFHIDDRPSKLQDTDSKVKLLYSRPWNEGCLNLMGNLIRVNSWQEIRDYVS